MSKVFHEVFPKLSEVIRGLVVSQISCSNILMLGYKGHENIVIEVDLEKLVFEVDSELNFEISCVMKSIEQISHSNGLPWNVVANQIMVRVFNGIFGNELEFNLSVNQYSKVVSFRITKFNI